MSFFKLVFSTTPEQTHHETPRKRASRRTYAMTKKFFEPFSPGKLA
jgi:hypothetical protein